MEIQVGPWRFGQILLMGGWGGGVLGVAKKSTGSPIFLFYFIHM
jgi:hypothetical protein